MKGNYKEVKAYLESFINYEKVPFFSYKESIKLERVRLLFEKLNIAHSSLNIVHVAGTKGKGSVSNFCACALAGLGYKTGLYTSPHFFDFRERIRIVKGTGLKIKDFLISKEDTAGIIKEFKLRLDKPDFSRGIKKPTFFEVYTALAIKFFLNKKVDFAVMETGLGGRLDATNVVEPAVSVITHIGYDHTDKLGKKLGDIAYEKAGVIKKGVPLVCSIQRPAALEVIKSECRRRKAPVFISGRDFKTVNVRIGEKHTLFDFEFGKVRMKNVKIRLKGACQVENAGCALASVLLLGEKLRAASKPAIKRGLRDCVVEGRFEVLSSNPSIVVDVAHNPSSFSALKDNLDVYFPGKKIILVFACSKDKDPKKMLKEIDYTYLIITRFNGSRACDPLMIKKTCGLDEAITKNTVKDALYAALRACEKGHVIVVSGSFFLAAEAKRLLRKENVPFGTRNCLIISKSKCHV